MNVVCSACIAHGYLPVHVIGKIHATCPVEPQGRWRDADTVVLKEKLKEKRAAYAALPAFSPDEIRTLQAALEHYAAHNDHEATVESWAKASAAKALLKKLDKR